MTDEKILLAKLEEEPGARTSQIQTKTAIMAGNNFGLTYLLARVRDRNPYSNYRVPDSLEEFEFTIKGVIRLEMMQSPELRAYRRALGASFTQKKTREKYTWRSRMLIKAFPNLEAVRTFLNQDPLTGWSNSQPVLLPPDLEQPDEWRLVLQIQDITLPEDKRLADIVADYLQNTSQVLVLEAKRDILSPII